MSTFTIPSIALVTPQLPAVPSKEQARGVQHSRSSVTNQTLPVQNPAPSPANPQERSTSETGVPAQRVGEMATRYHGLIRRPNWMATRTRFMDQIRFHRPRGAIALMSESGVSMLMLIG